MSSFLLVVVAKDGRRTDGLSGAGLDEIQHPILFCKHFIFLLYLTSPSILMFSSSIRVGMKLYISIFQCLSFCWWSSRRTDAGRTVSLDQVPSKPTFERGCNRVTAPARPLRTIRDGWCRADRPTGVAAAGWRQGQVDFFRQEARYGRGARPSGSSTAWAARWAESEPPKRTYR